MTTRCYLYFKPEEFYPVPEGTILRYLGHDYEIDKQRYGVVMEVIGLKPKDAIIPQIQFVDATIHIAPGDT